MAHGFSRYILSLHVEMKAAAEQQAALQLAHKVSVDGLISSCTFPSSAHLQKCTSITMLGYKSGIDLCATIIDRFLTNMLEQMEELNGIEMATETTPEAMRFKLHH